MPILIIYHFYKKIFSYFFHKGRLSILNEKRTKEFKSYAIYILGNIAYYSYVLVMVNEYAENQQLEDNLKIAQEQADQINQQKILKNNPPLTR